MGAHTSYKQATRHRLLLYTVLPKRGLWVKWHLRRRHEVLPSNTTSNEVSSVKDLSLNTLWKASVSINNSLGCLVNSDTCLGYPENCSLKHSLASMAHWINPLPSQGRGFPLNFSRIHLDLWFTIPLALGEMASHCLWYFVVKWPCK